MPKKTRIIRLKSLKNQRIIADQCSVAERFFVRMQGLIGKNSLKSGAGMLFPKCNSIHMWFMKFPIDIVFLKEIDQETYEVSSIRKSAPAWSLLPYFDYRANSTLELPEGCIEKFDVQPGDQICIS